MAKIKITRRNESERLDGRAPLYANININREKIRIPVELSVTKKEWDPDEERIRGRGAEIRDKNLIISNIKAKITDILVRSRLSGEQLTKRSFISLYRLPANDGDFISFAHRHIDSLRQALQWNTLRQHTAILKKLEQYRPNLHLHEITTEFLRTYAVHLRDKMGNCPNTVGKNLSVIRVYYYAAMRAGLVLRNPFEAFRIPQGNPGIVFLTEEELNNLIELFRSNELTDIEQDVLRFFLFMTFTGMHITDARGLQIEQIFGGEIHYTRQKTRTKVAVPLSVPAEKLTDYYRAGRRRGNLFVKLPTDQAFNRIIKRICQKVGILKPISAKAGRHTFATIYYKRNGGDLGTLSKLLGHKSINTTMIYAHIMKDSRVAGVSAFNDML